METSSGAACNGVCEQAETVDSDIDFSRFRNIAVNNSQFIPESMTELNNAFYRTKTATSEPPSDT